MSTRAAIVVSLAVMIDQDELTIAKAEEYLRNLDKSFSYTEIPTELPLVLAALKGAKING